MPEHAEGRVVGYVIVEWNQASGQPDLDVAPSLHDDREWAEKIRAEMEAENRASRRWEIYRVCAVIELEGADA